jgi:hypothetical protein
MERVPRRVFQVRFSLAVSFKRFAADAKAAPLSGNIQ